MIGREPLSPHRTGGPGLVALLPISIAVGLGALFFWGVYGVPETYSIDAQGRIAYKHIGPFDQHVLWDTILPIVVELQSKESAS